jgi:hypothetical protein
MPIANIVARDGKTIASTVTLTDTQAAQYVTLAAAVQAAQNMTHLSAYDVLGRLEELIDHTFKRRMAAVPRDTVGNGVSNLEVFHDAHPMPTPAQNAQLRAIRPDGNFVQAAVDLGMLLSFPAASAEFSRAELYTTGIAPRAFVRWRV